MNTFKTLLAISVLVAFLGNVSFADPSTSSQVQTELSTDLKTVGDFALFDSKGSLFSVGRIMLDFASVYTVLAKYPEARGECTFRYVQYTDGKPGKTATRSMRYFFRFDKPSYIYLNTDVAEAEMQLEVNFDPGPEFASGSIKIPAGSGMKDAGSCKIRMR